MGVTVGERVGRGLRGGGRALPLLVLLCAAPGVPAAEGGMPPWLSQSVRLELDGGGADPGHEARTRAPTPGGEALRRWARRLQGTDGHGPGFWYERRTVYLGVRRQF